MGDKKFLLNPKWVLEIKRGELLVERICSNGPIQKIICRKEVEELQYLFKEFQKLQ